MPTQSSRPGADGASWLLALVGRSAPPHRPVGDLLRGWHAASGTDLAFDEWADPATGDLAAAFDHPTDLASVERAVVAFAQARAGADHGVEAVAADLVALARMAWPSGRVGWVDGVDPVGLLARALGAWAVERAAATSASGCIDPVTRLATGPYLRERVRELHRQCRALAISPPGAFGAVIVELDLAPAVATERIAFRVAAGRLLAARFRAGETAAAVAPGRLVAVMPAYGVDRARDDVRVDFARLAARGGLGVAVTRQAFADDASATFASLAGTPVGP